MQSDSVLSVGIPHGIVIQKSSDRHSKDGIVVEVKQIVQKQPSEEGTMLRWAAIFFVIAIIAGLFGFTGIAAASAQIAQILFGIFLVLFLIFLIVGLVTAGGISRRL